MNPVANRPTIAALAISMWAMTPFAQADGNTPVAQGQAHRHIRCEREIENAIARSNGMQEAPTHEVLQADQRPHDARHFQATAGQAKQTGADCTQHPWVRQADAWHMQGMTIETAMQWLIVAPESAPTVRLHPQLDSQMEDLARMRAAYTLALAGHTPDAIRLWTDLSIRRPHWAEVWFNLGLASFSQSEHESARRHFRQARLLCQRRACALAPDQLDHWSNQVKEQP